VTRRGWILFGVMGVIWGIPYLLIKVAVGELSPASLVFLRTTTGALVLLPIAARRGAIAPLLAHWRWLLVYTVIEVAIPWMLLSDAETHISSSLAGLLVAAVPFVGALLALLTGGDDRLEVCILVHPNDRPLVEPELRDFAQLQYRLLDIEQVAQKLGLKPPPLDSTAEEVMVHLFLLRKAQNHFASPELMN